MFCDTVRVVIQANLRAAQKGSINRMVQNCRFLRYVCVGADSKALVGLFFHSFINRFTIVLA